MEGSLQCKYSSMEDDLQGKTTFGGRQPLVEDDFWWNTILACCLVCFAAFFGDNICLTKSFLNQKFFWPKYFFGPKRGRWYKGLQSIFGCNFFKSDKIFLFFWYCRGERTIYNRAELAFQPSLPLRKIGWMASNNRCYSQNMTCSATILFNLKDFFVQSFSVFL